MISFLFKVASVHSARWALSLGVSCVCLSACGGPRSTTDPETNWKSAAPAAALTASLQAFVGAFCATARTCCAALGADLAPLVRCELQNSLDLGSLLVSVDLVQSGRLEPGKLASLVREGTVTVDEQALAKCTSDLTSAVTNCGPQPIAQCSAAFHGTVAEGGACRLAEECAAPNPGDTVYCVRRYLTGDTKPKVGVCHVLPHAHAGDACAGNCTEMSRKISSSTVCSQTWSVGDPEAFLSTQPSAMCHHADGLSCVAGTCQASKAAGDPCVSADDDCGDGFNCPVNTCQAEGSAGDDCGAGCREGLSCQGDQNLACAPKPFADGYLCEGNYL